MNDMRTIKDGIARRAMALFCIGIAALFVGLCAGLASKSLPVLTSGAFPGNLLSSRWQPSGGEFGLGTFILGTLWVTSVGMAIAVPVSLFAAIYLSEYAHRTARKILRPVIDVCAGISPVVYGVWGVLVVVPAVRAVMPGLMEAFPFFPFLSDNMTGFSVLSGGIVLAVMVTPLIIFVTEGVLGTVPREMRDASTALGASRWQTIRRVVLVKSWPGIIAAVMLGLSRAVGETIAVLMVSGCSLFGSPGSVFDPAYPLPAMIANTYGEMMSVPHFNSAVMFAALVLLVLTMVFNVTGWGILLYVQKKAL